MTTPRTPDHPQGLCPIRHPAASGGVMRESSDPVGPDFVEAGSPGREMVVYSSTRGVYFVRPADRPKCLLQMQEVDRFRADSAGMIRTSWRLPCGDHLVIYSTSMPHSYLAVMVPR